MSKIEIDVSKLERGLREGQVKVTRGGKTFYRKQRVGRKEVEDLTTPKAKFETMEDVNAWIDTKAKEYGSKNEFLSSKEYADAYPEIKKVHSKATESYNVKATESTGLNVGDRVHYAVVSPYGIAEELEGIVVKYRGAIRIKLDQKQDGKRYVAPHKGWKILVKV
ncbi:MAG: hypothetical protein KAS07_06125 [Candidatus Pacebacteria bacterium]|nr:hypothetical protein [Candidatus Paceibacterota bacterium]